MQVCRSYVRTTPVLQQPSLPQFLHLLLHALTGFTFDARRPSSMWRGYRQALSLLPIENIAHGRQAAQSIAPSASVRRAVVDMVKWRQGSLVVRDGEDGPILGTITERDVLERVELVAGAMQATRVDQIMTPRSELASCSTDSALGQCVRKMQPGFRQLPIVAGERVLSIISIRDIAQHMATALSKAPMHDPPTVDQLMVSRGAPGYVELKASSTYDPT